MTMRNREKEQKKSTGGMRVMLSSVRFTCSFLNLSATVTQKTEGVPQTQNVHIERIFFVPFQHLGKDSCVCASQPWASSPVSQMAETP